MKRSTILILAIIYLCSCNSTVEKSNNIDSVKTIVQTNKIDSTNNYFKDELKPNVKIEIEIDSSLKQWQYFILAMNFKSNILFQKLKVKQDDTIKINPSVELVDMNFDGYFDIRFITERSGDGNEWNQCWLFDTMANKYVYHEGLTNLISPDFYPETKTIKAGYWGGINEQHFDTYTFQGNKLKIK